MVQLRQMLPVVEKWQSECWFHERLCRIYSNSKLGWRTELKCPRSNNGQTRWTSPDIRQYWESFPGYKHTAIIIALKWYPVRLETKSGYRSNANLRTSRLHTLRSSSICSFEFELRVIVSSFRALSRLSNRWESGKNEDTITRISRPSDHQWYLSSGWILLTSSSFRPRS